MPRTVVAAVGSVVLVVALVVSFACQGAVVQGPATEADAAAESIHDRFAGNWRLVKTERFDADDELIVPATGSAAAASPGRLGFLMYDPAGYMGVVIMQGGRQPYSDGGPTPDEARASLRSYTSYFGPYTVDEAEGVITHHVRGSRTPNSTGRDNVREFEFDDNLLMLKPPRAASGVQSRLTWERVPEADLSAEGRKFVGFWQIRSVDRRTAGGESRPATQYADGYISYTASGHMAVHLMRPDRPRYESSPPSDDDISTALQGYTSYFGPFSVDEDEQVVTHERLGSTTPTAGRPTPFPRNYEFRDNTLILSPPGRMVDGQEVRSYLTWERLSK